MARPTTQELLEKQKEIAEKFNAQQIEQDKLRQEYEKITAIIADRQAGEAEIVANVAAETCPAPEVTPASVDPAPGADVVTVERGT
tara:strand:- start:39 stop:296 length:258 start_codon:yes stop_codon:yes gene_type:complete